MEIVESSNYPEINNKLVDTCILDNKKDICSNNIKLLSTNEDYFKTITINRFNVDVYKNNKFTKIYDNEYVLIHADIKDKYYIKKYVLDKLQLQDIKEEFIRDLYYYTHLVVKFPEVGDVKIDIYKDLPDVDVEKY